MGPTRSTRPIFIVGMQRSGTSLMRSLLSSHPSIAIAPKESRYFHKYVGATADARISDFEDFWETFATSSFFTSLQIDSDVTKARLDGSGPPNYETVLEVVLDEYAKKEHKPRWGDKTPGHERYYDVLLQWFPDAQVIHMIRDPRSVIASLLTVPWRRQLRPYVDGFAERWREGARLAERSARDDRLRVVHYEALVSNPEAELRSICAFLREPYASEMLSSRTSPRTPTEAPSSGDGQQARPDQHGPITASSVERWRAVLSVQQVAIIEHMTRRQMLEYGYHPVTTALPTHVVPQFLAMRTARNSIRGVRHAWRVLASSTPAFRSGRLWAARRAGGGTSVSFTLPLVPATAPDDETTDDTREPGETTPVSGPSEH